jgi:site-specific recombinase XerD
MYLLKEMFNNYLSHIKKYKRNGTFVYYSKNFILIQKALDYLKINETTEICDNFFEIITDYLMNFTIKKNSKINDTISCIITVLNFYSVKYPRRFKLKDDTTSFKPLNDYDYKKLREYVSKINIKESNNLSLTLCIFLSLDTGVRLTELLNIKFENVDFTTNSIFLELTKNGCQRYVFFGELSCKYLRKAYRFKQQYVMWNYTKNCRMSKHSIYHFFEKINKALKTTHSIHHHRLRKTYATRLLKKGCPLTTISKLLGHKDIKQTMIYLEIDNSMLKIDYDNYYPY